MGIRFYTVRAGNQGGFLSDPMLPPVGMIAAFVPGPPRNLVAVMTAPFQTRLDWEIPLDDGGDSLTFYLVRSSQGQAWNSYVESTLLTHQYGGQGQVQTTYFISAGNRVGYGPETNFSMLVTDFSSR